MHIVRRQRHGFFVALIAAPLLAGVGRLSAHEPVTAFVDALCERGYFDTAVAYLEVLKSATYVSEDVKKSVAFHQGAVLMRQAEGIDDLSVKAKLYDEAAGKLKQFLAASPDSEIAASASGRLAKMEVERARSVATIALVSPKDEREEKLVGARKVFDQASAQLSAAEKVLVVALGKLPKHFAPEDEDKKQRKNELSAELAETQLTAASVDYELSKTYERGSEESKRYLKFAAQKFGKIFEDYRTRGAGLFAHLWEGKCYQELGDRRRAIAAYQDLLELPAKSADLRTVRAKALRQAIEVWCLPEEKKYDEAIRQGEEWLATADRLPTGDPDALAIRYATAVAYHKQMTSLGPKDPERKRLQQIALRLARVAARHPGEFKDQAAKLVTALGGAKEKDPDAAPDTLIAARDRGKEALERIQSLHMSRDVAVETEDQDEIARLDIAEKQAKAEAAQFFKLALTLDPGKAKPEEINSVRYYVSFFNYDEANYVDAAVIGEYLALNFPQTAEARPAARIALASWVKAYSTSRVGDKSFEIGKINRLAEFIIKTWPDQEEAGEASATLLSFAIQQRDTAKVLQYLERIPAESPRRGDSELRAGQALWSNYLKAARLPEGERPSDKELESTKTSAAEILEKGIERMKESGDVSPTLVTAVLALAQIQVDTGHPEKAIEWLENETIGPLKLLNDGNEVVGGDKMSIEIYKLALRAYVAVEPQRLEDAERIMNALEKAVSESGDAQASETLTVIYIALGRELQQQLEELRNSKKNKELKAVSAGFETFLSRIVGRKKGNTWSSLNWVAETFYSLGTGFDDGKTPRLSPDAKRYYEQAVKAYEAILARADAEKAFAPTPNALVGVRLRMAVCLRKIGHYDDAIKSIVNVLRARPMMLPAQILGAETYQAKGALDKDAYGFAILGGGDKDKKGQPIIWGWAKLSKMTMNNDKFADTFHEARIKLSECRYLYGMLVKDADKAKEQNKRHRTLDAARQDLWMTYKLYPKLGGEARASEYDRLLKRIQQGLGERPTGLEEFRRRAAETDKAALNNKSTT